MPKYTLLLVCTICIFAIGYISWDLIAKSDSESTELNVALNKEDIATTSGTQKLDSSTINSDPTELSIAKQSENTLPDKENISTTISTQKLDVSLDSSAVNDVVTLKSNEGSYVSVDNTKRTVTSEQFMKNLSTCTASIITDKDYGIFPDDTTEPDLVTLDWNLEIKSGSVNDCKINFGYALYDIKSIKQVEKMTQCTFNFKDLSEKQVRVLYEDVLAAFSFGLTNKMLTLDTDKLSGIESMYVNEELKDLNKIDKETIIKYSEINEENISRVKCSDKFVAVVKEVAKKDINPPISTGSISSSSGDISDTIKKLLSGLRSKAEIHYNQDFTYAGLCSNESVISVLNKALTTINGETYTPNVHGLNSYVAQNSQQKSTASCHVNYAQYVIAAPDIINSGFWCIDSTGAVKQKATAPAANSFSCT